MASCLRFWNMDISRPPPLAATNTPARWHAILAMHQEPSPPLTVLKQAYFQAVVA